MKLLLIQVTEMLVNILNICSDDELVAGPDDELEEGKFGASESRCCFSRSCLNVVVLWLLWASKETLELQTNLLLKIFSEKYNNCNLLLPPIIIYVPTRTNFSLFPKNMYIYIYK